MNKMRILVTRRKLWWCWGGLVIPCTLCGGGVPTSRRCHRQPARQRLVAFLGASTCPSHMCLCLGLSACCAVLCCAVLNMQQQMEGGREQQLYACWLLMGHRIYSGSSRVHAAAAHAHCRATCSAQLPPLHPAEIVVVIQ